MSTFIDVIEIYRVSMPLVPHSVPPRVEYDLLFGPVGSQ